MKKRLSSDLPLPQKLRITSSEHYAHCAKMLATYSPDDLESFPLAVELCLSVGFKPSDLAEVFKISESTISRWRQGRSLPLGYVRGIVVDRLRNLLAARAQAKMAESTPQTRPTQVSKKKIQVLV